MVNGKEDSAVHKSYELVIVETSECMLIPACSDIMVNDMSASRSARILSRENEEVPKDLHQFGQLILMQKPCTVLRYSWTSAQAHQHAWPQLGLSDLPEQQWCCSLIYGTPLLLPLYTCQRRAFKNWLLMLGKTAIVPQGI